MSTSGVSLRHTLLISSNPQVADALRQITDRFQASLTRIDHVPPFVHQHMDLVFLYQCGAAQRQSVRRQQSNPPADTKLIKFAQEAVAPSP
jgi:hypothetical protein